MSLSRCLVAVSLLVAWPLLAALSAGREIPLATAVVEPSPFLRDTVRAASNGRDFLVVWNDVFEMHQGREVRAARVTAEGEVLDASLVIAQNSGSVLGVASNGRDYVVAYDCASVSASRHTCLAHVDATTGAVTQTASIEKAGFGAIASNGNGYLLAYHYDTRSTVHAVAVRDDGTLAGPRFLLGHGRFAPWLASNGEHYYAVWNTYQHLVGMPLSDRAPIGEVQTLTAQPPSWGPAAFGWTVASDGDDFLVVWQQNVRVTSPVYETQLRARVVSRSGTVGDSRALVADEEAFHPAAVWTGSEYLLTYTRSERQSAPYLWPDSDGDIRGLHVDSSGRPSAAPVTIAGRRGREAASVAASDGTSTLIAWQRVHSRGAGQIEGLLTTGGISQATPFVISRSVSWQDFTTAARIGASTIAVWDERIGEQQLRKVFLQRLDDEGHPLLGRGLAVAETALDQLHPALGGSAVVWVQQERDSYTRPASIHLRFLEGDGQLALDRPLPLGDAQPFTRVAVVAAGTTHLVVWTAMNGQIVGMRVSPAGHLDVQPFVISSEAGRGVDPVVASDGTNFFVAWTSQAPGSTCGVCFPLESINGVAVSSAGTVIGAPFELSPPQATRPSLLWNGERYVAFWFHAGFNAGLIRSAYVQELDRGGNAVAAPRAIKAGGAPLAAVWTGSGYLVATAAGDVRSGQKLQVERLSRDFAPLELVPAVTRWRGSVNVSIVAHRGDGALLIYEAFLAGGGISSRAVVRPIGQGLATPRRRAAR